MLEFVYYKTRRKKLDDCITENLYKPYALSVPLTKGQ